MRERVDIKIRLTSPGARVPWRGSDGSVGFDLQLPAYVIVGPASNPTRIPLGFEMELPKGWEAQIRPRSSTPSRFGIDVMLGTIDWDYRGEVALNAWSLTDAWVGLDAGDRIAQMVIARVPVVSWHSVSELGHTDRGSGGFGSTGR